MNYYQPKTMRADISNIALSQDLVKALVSYDKIRQGCHCYHVAHKLALETDCPHLQKLLAGHIHLTHNRIMLFGLAYGLDAVYIQIHKTYFTDLIGVFYFDVGKGALNAELLKLMWEGVAIPYGLVRNGI